MLGLFAALALTLSLGADTIPGQLPPSVVLRSAAAQGQGQRLRGDFEPPPWILLAHSSLWPDTLTAIAEQVLASGTGLALVREAESSRRSVERWLQELSGREGAQLMVFDEPVDTPWARDWGPLQLYGSEGSTWIDARVLGGEGLRRGDDAAPSWLAHHLEVPVEALDWLFDGGAVVSNGAGLCVVTGEFLTAIAVSGDPGEAWPYLARLGCTTSAVVPTLVAEQTKHADMIAQFVSPTRLMLAQLVDADPRGAGPSEDTLRLEQAAATILEAAALAGVEIELFRVPTPASELGRNPRSYVNGLRLRDRYLMPSYPALGQAQERAALDAVRRALDEVPVVPIDSSELIAAGGAIHCATSGLFVR